MLSIANARESFSADQLAQITQIVSQSILSFFKSQHATTTATHVDEQPTIPPLERLEQLGQFPFLSSSELQQQPTSSHGPVASISQADGGFTPEIPNKYVRDIESGEFFELAKLLPKNLNKLNVVGSDSSDNVGFTISSTGISLTPRKPQVLTNIEDIANHFQHVYVNHCTKISKSCIRTFTVYRNHPSCGKNAWRFRLVHI
jgi:hypothetical protein